MPHLILVRHGQSEWNLEKRFTGWVDVDLTGQGKLEACKSGEYIKELKIDIDYFYSSFQLRAINTLKLIQDTLRDNRKPKEKEFGLSVEVRNGNVEQALRKLKKKMMNDGLLQTLRDRQHFISNTEKRLKAQSASKARHRRREAQDSIVKKRMY